MSTLLTHSAHVIFVINFNTSRKKTIVACYNATGHQIFLILTSKMCIMQPSNFFFFFFFAGDFVFFVIFVFCFFFWWECLFVLVLGFCLFFVLGFCLFFVLVGLFRGAFYGGCLLGGWGCLVFVYFWVLFSFCLFLGVFAFFVGGCFIFCFWGEELVWGFLGGCFV